MTEAHRTGDGRTITVRIPISIRRRGGRKLVLAPDGTTDTWAAPRRRIDNAMVKAIARAFRWREMLENGTHATIAELAAAEKINESYVGRALRVTLLAQDIRGGARERAAAGEAAAQGTAEAVSGGLAELRRHLICSIF